MINKQNRGIFLDFDGVLFDTIKEAYCTALITTKKYNHINEVDFNTGHYHLFSQFRYLITSAWTYYYLLKLIKKPVGGSVFEETFYNNILNPDVESHNKFEKKFFRNRKRLRETDTQNWLSLNKPYPFLKKIKPLLSDYNDEFYIITTKNKEAVLEIIQFYKIRFKKSNIFGTDCYKKYHSKGRLIETIAKEKQIKKIIFIDDSANHLDDCRNILKINLFQPDWGYVKPGDPTSNEKRILTAITSILGD